jgi:hypothetical protein
LKRVLEEKEMRLRMSESKLSEKYEKEIIEREE